MARLLFVHAHPDDETINNGATMAWYAARGAQVTLVTCTRGELGEVIPPELAHLAEPAAGRGSETLGAHRVGELAGAMAALGVRDHRFLGAPDLVYRDSGMALAADGSVVPVPDLDPKAFVSADLDQAARMLAKIIQDLEPDVVTSYDPLGGYGHPDHVQAHRVMMRAVELSTWPVPALYWTLPPSRAQEATAVIEAPGQLAAKVAAMRAHRTQIRVLEPADSASGSASGSGPDGSGWRYALSNGVIQPLTATEHYRRVGGEATRVRGDLIVMP